MSFMVYNVMMQSYTLFGTQFNNNPDSAISLTEIVSTNWLNDINITVDAKDPEDTFDLEEAMFNALDKGVFFKVTGNSMRDAGIFDGDIAIVEKGRNASIGDIVIALVNGKYAIRYFAQDEDGSYFLRSANKKYKAIYSKEMSIFGVVISVFRSIKK